MINELSRLEYLKRDFVQCLEAVITEAHIASVTEDDMEAEAQVLISDCMGVSKIMESLLSKIKESSFYKTEVMEAYASPEEIKAILKEQAGG